MVLGLALEDGFCGAVIVAEGEAIEMIGVDFCGGNEGSGEVDNAAGILACGDGTNTGDPVGIDGREVIG